MNEQLVKPIEIEDELMKIWDDLQGKNKMRACLFNLVIYSKNDDRRSYLESIVKRVIHHYPCRIIFITEDASQSDSMESSVSVMSAEETDNAILCDLIKLNLFGEERRKAHFLLLPHILPDLPIYMVWGCDPTENTDLLFKLEDLASKTILNPELANCLPEFASTIFYHIQKTESALIDLNWARTEGWRNLIASIFYCDDKLQFLQEAERIDINYNCRENGQCHKTQIQSVYLQAWLASTMGWKLKSQDDGKYIYHNGHKHIIIELTATEHAEMKPGRILSVGIEHEGDEAYHFERKKKSPYIVEIRHTTATLCETPAQFLFDKEESGQSLSQELFHRGTSKHFLRTLKFIEEGVVDE